MKATFTEPTLGTNILYSQAIPCEIFYSSLMKTDTVHELNESIKLRKPDMSKFMYTKNKAAIGTISAKDAQWQLSTFGAVEVAGEAAFTTGPL